MDDKMRQLVNEYNSINKMTGDVHNNNVENFFQKNNIVGLQITNYGNRMIDPDIPILIKDIGNDSTDIRNNSHFFGIQKGNGKYLVLPKFLQPYIQIVHDASGASKLFNSNYNPEEMRISDIELNEPAEIELGKNGEVKVKSNGDLKLHQHKSYYQTGNIENSSQFNEQSSDPLGNQKNASHQETHETPSQNPKGTPQKPNTNEQTPPPEKFEPPPAKPEPSQETPVNAEEAYRRLNEEAAKKSRKQAENTEKYVRGNLIAQETGKQQSAEIEANMKKIREEKETKEAQKSELKNNIGPDNEKGYVSSAVGSTSRSWRKNHTNEENRFIDARRYYAKNLDTIEQQKSRIIAAKDSFLKNYDESMISDESMGKMKAAFEEAKSEHNQSILEAKRAGRSAPLLNDAKVNSQINSQIAQKVFGKAEDAELAAVDYMRKKNNAEGIIAKAENRNSVLRKYIDSAQEKGENKIARGAKAGGLGWKGKAAIFGGVALGALSLVGVASMVMSGGRQQNSNLYNPYQAMY